MDQLILSILGNSWILLLITFPFYFALKKNNTNKNEDNKIIERLHYERMTIFTTRMLIIGSYFILIFVDYTLSYILKAYIVNWYVNLFILLFLVYIHIFTYLKRSNINTITNLIRLCYLLANVLLLQRLYFNDFVEIHLVITSIIIIYSIFVFQKLKNILLFILLVSIFSFFAVYYSKASFLIKLGFIFTLVIDFLTVVIFIVIQNKNSLQTKLSDQILRSVKSYIILGDKNGNFLYVNEYLLKVTGKNSKELLGNGWWKFISDNEEQMLIKKRNHI